jgi:uncharacterized repeat protein (TIGR01451 family)
VTITITATVNAGTGGSTISNQGTVSYDADVNGSNEATKLSDDPGVGGAADPTNFTVAAVDLTLSKDDGGASAVAGDTIAYTLTYNNVGTAGATGVVLTETVPADTTFNPGASNPGWSCVPDNNAGSTCSNPIGTVAAGGNGAVVFAVTVDSPVVGFSQISNTASIADDGNNGADLTPGDNSDTDTTPVLSLVYYTVTPCRLLDTRNAAGPYGAPALIANSNRSFVAAGQCGVPVDAAAISINITVLNATVAGDLRSYPTGIAAPLVSVINYNAGQTRANNAVVPLGTGGAFDLQCDQLTGTVDAIVDINGYFR